MTAGIKANVDGSAAIQVGGTDVITLTSGGAATFVTSPTTVQAGTAAAPSITFSGDTNTGIYSPGADTIAFTEGGVEGMRINSVGNVGIGTTSPGNRLHVLQTLNANAVNTQARFQDNGTTGGTSYQQRISISGKSGAGNIDIGTTDSSTIHFSGQACAFVTADTLPFNIVNLSAQPLLFGTNAAERMRVDANGNFGIGTTSPATTFHAANTNGGGVSGANPSGEVSRIQQTPSAGSGGYVAQRLFLNKTSTANDGVTQSFEGLAVGGDRYALANIGGYIDNAGSGNAVSGYFAILTKPTNASITERARISSSGAFGVSNTSPSYLVESGSNGGNDALIRAQGGFLTRKYSVSENRAGARTMRLTLSVNSLQFVNIFLDASAHRYDNGGSWQAFRLALQFMCEGSILRLNQRMPNYEYGGSTFGVFTFGNPPSWTFVSGATWYFDFTVAANHVGYYTLTVQGPGAFDATLTTIV